MEVVSIWSIQMMELHIQPRKNMHGKPTSQFIGEFVAETSKSI